MIRMITAAAAARVMIPGVVVKKEISKPANAATAVAWGASAEAETARVSASATSIMAAAVSLRQAFFNPKIER